MNQKTYLLKQQVFRKENMPDWMFIIWAGGTALLSYSLVYALRKPFTAAEFTNQDFFGMDYKIAVSIVQLYWDMF